MPNLRELQPWLYPYASQLLQYAPHARVASVYRTWTQQAYLYRRFLRGQADFPAAPPGQSYHQIRRAFDIDAPAETLAQLGQIWEHWGGRWGGRGGDPIHFEV